MTEVDVGRRLRVVTVDGGRGAARVVLVHGSMDTSESFRGLADCLTGCTVVRYDRHGYGGSREEGRRGNTFAEHVGDLLAVLDGQPSVVVGHSLGGAIALSAAARAPDTIRAALVYEVPMPWLAWWPASAVTVPADDAGPAEERRFAAAFLRHHIGDGRWAQLTEATRQQLLAPASALAAELRSARLDRPVPFDPHGLSVPVVAVHGTATDERHVRSTELLARDIPGARIVRIPGADHRGHRRHAAELAELARPLFT